MPVKKKVTRSVIPSKTRNLSRMRVEKGFRGLSIPVYSLTGRASGTLSLPKDIFGQEANQNLLAQAIRVYTTNQKRFTAKTKTRGEVKGSSAKIYRQKGTGRARHGSIRAPIFVGGGIVFGPRPRKVELGLPKKMKRKALIYALSAKAKDKEIVGLIGLEKATGKTKEIAKLIEKLKIKSALFITGQNLDDVVRGVRNITGMSVLPTNQLNAYEILRHQSLLITKDAIQKLSGKEVKK